MQFIRQNGFLLVYTIFCMRMFYDTKSKSNKLSGVSGLVAHRIL